MRIPPPDHGEVLSGIELGGKAHALGMSYDPVEKFSGRTRQADYFARCPIELRNAQRLAVIRGEVVEAVEHGKLPPSVVVVWGGVHVSAADIYPLPSWPVVPPVGFYGITYQDVPYEQQIVVACHTLGGTKCRLPHSPQLAIYVTTSKDGRPPPPESRHVLRTTPTITQGWAVELMQHPHRDDMACPIGPRLQMLRNIHNILVGVYACSRRRSFPQVAVGVLRLFGLYLQAKEQMYPKGLGNRQDILVVPIIECTSLRLVE